eukprot:748476-Hanusia_phi.AAC.1
MRGEERRGEERRGDMAKREMTRRDETRRRDLEVKLDLGDEANVDVSGAESRLHDPDTWHSLKRRRAGGASRRGEESSTSIEQPSQPPGPAAGGERKVAGGRRIKGGEVTAVSKPNDRSMTQMSLSMVLGMPMMETLREEGGTMTGQRHRSGSRLKPNSASPYSLSYIKLHSRTLTHIASSSSDTITHPTASQHRIPTPPSLMSSSLTLSFLAFASSISFSAAACVPSPPIT